MAKTSKEKLHSRRQFFKKAAKSVLPILGAIALTQMPFLSQAHESQDEMGCSRSCYFGCSGNCTKSCLGSCCSCNAGCSVGCRNYCDHNCFMTCLYSAKMTTDSIQNDTTIIKR